LRRKGNPKMTSLDRSLKLVAAVLLGAATLAVARTAPAHILPVAPAALEVYDRSDGTVLAVHEKDGRRYIVGVPGHEYALRLRNLSGGRILAVTSVDGVNVVTGDTASPDQSGYVIDPYASVEIAGWRKGLDRIAAFYFTDLGDSYAARTGRPRNVGVIGVAVFREKVAYGDNITPYHRRAEAAEPKDAERAQAPSPMPATPPSEAGAAGAPASREPRDEPASALDSAIPQRSAKSLASPLGTGHGRSETSYVQQVRFERATAGPAQMLTVQYDRRENLVAMGVIRDENYAWRDPRPFPGTLRFVPDPR